MRTLLLLGTLLLATPTAQADTTVAPVDYTKGIIDQLCRDPTLLDSLMDFDRGFVHYYAHDPADSEDNRIVRTSHIQGPAGKQVVLQFLDETNGKDSLWCEHQALRQASIIEEFPLTDLVLAQPFDRTRLTPYSPYTTATVRCSIRQTVNGEWQIAQELCFVQTGGRWLIAFAAESPSSYLILTAKLQQARVAVARKAGLALYRHPQKGR